MQKFCQLLLFLGTLGRAWFIVLVESELLDSLSGLGRIISVGAAVLVVLPPRRNGGNGRSIRAAMERRGSESRMRSSCVVNKDKVGLIALGVIEGLRLDTFDPSLLGVFVVEGVILLVIAATACERSHARTRR